MTGRRAFLATAAAAFLAGCSGGGDGDDGPVDSDGDGVPDSEDYAPQDPDVQEKSDLSGGDGGATATSGATATPTESDDGGLEKVDEGTPTEGDRGTPPAEKRPDGDPETLLDQRLTLSSGERRTVPLELEGPATLEYQFRTMNLAIDVFLMPRSEYERLRGGFDPTWNEAGSTPGTDADRVVAEVEPIADDDWLLVLDNSDLGEAGPSKNAAVDDAVDLRATITVYRQS